MAAGRQHNDHGLGYRFELGTKMYRAFHGKDFLLLGLDANVTEQLPIMSLHALAADHDAHAADGEGCHWSEVDLPPADGDTARYDLS
jgi:hypothetical protein